MYLVGTTVQGPTEHATDQISLEEGFYPDSDDSLQYMTLCGIPNPIVWEFTWHSSSPFACHKCIERFNRRIKE